eukprot:1421012-Pyramimonas_sp.AAC.1
MHYQYCCFQLEARKTSPNCCAYGCGLICKNSCAGIRRSIAPPAVAEIAARVVVRALRAAIVGTIAWGCSKSCGRSGSESCRVAAVTLVVLAVVKAVERPSLGAVVCVRACVR